MAARRTFLLLLATGCILHSIGRWQGRANGVGGEGSGGEREGKWECEVKGEVQGRAGGVGGGGEWGEEDGEGRRREGMGGLILGGPPELAILYRPRTGKHLVIINTKRT